jgi:PAS domain S-box-containing protein
MMQEQSMRIDDAPHRGVGTGIHAGAWLVGWVSLFLVFCGAPGLASSPAPRPVLRSGCELDYPPFCIVHDDGSVDGFSVELLQAAARAMGRTVTFRTGPWAEVKGLLVNGEVDALPLVGRTPEREGIFDFTFPYLTMHGGIVVRKDTEGIRNLGDLVGHRVAVMASDNAEEYLRREERGMIIVTTPTFSDAFREVSQGRCDAVVVQRLVGLRTLNHQEFTNLRMLDTPIRDFKQDFCFAVREGDRDTLATLNEGLALVVADGTHRRLHAKWFAALQLPSDRPIIVAGDHNYPPFEFLDANGQPAGFTVDLTRAIAKELDLDVEIRLGPWAGIRQDLDAGKVDVMQGLFYSSERDRTLDFSPHFLVSNYVGVVRKGLTPPETLDDLAGLRVVVQDGDIMETLAKNSGVSMVLSAVGTHEDALLEVEAGRQDCALVTRVVALYLIDERGWNNLELGESSLFAGKYCYAALGGQDAVLAEFSEGLRVLEHTGEYQRICDKWLGVYQERAVPWSWVLKYVPLIAGPLLGVALLSLVWLWTLRREVARRTAELHESAEFQRAMIDCSPMAVYAVASDGTVLTWNASAERLFGWTAKEAVGTFLPTIPADSRNAFRELREEAGSGSGFVGREVVRKRRDGSLFPAALSAAALHDADGEVVGFMATVEDITWRKQSEKRITHLNRVLQATRDVNQLIVRESDEETLVDRVCRVLVDNRGYPAALVVLTESGGGVKHYAQAGMGSLFPPLARWMDSGKLPPCCEQASNYEGVYLVANAKAACAPCPIADDCKGTGVMCVRLRHGEDVYGYLAVSSDEEIKFGDEERGLFEELADDLAYALHSLATETARAEFERAHERAQLQLAQAQKLESIGRLAGGVAHDFNNLLMGIMGYTDLCRDDVGEEHPANEWLDEIKKAAERSANLTRKLLAFARRQTIAPELLDVNATVADMLRMLQRLIGEDIELSWLPDEHPCMVEMDPGQVDQILANLCVNARDAMLNGGKVTIETQLVEIDEQYCGGHVEAVPGSYVLLAVSDNGKGMDEDTLAHVFEPFFTTKPAGEGTGLGLATIYGIAKQNHGFVSLYSELGEGTTVRIYLPRFLGELDGSRKEEEAAPVDEGGRGETILLVEDESSVRATAGAFLQGLDYRVLVAEGPEDALRQVAELEGVVDLLVTDVVMPGMNGRVLAEELSKSFPDMRCLYISGYTANVIAHSGILEQGVNFLAKPFNRQELLRRVRQVLDS